jgi:predicted nucleic acid-binding protein
MTTIAVDTSVLLSIFKGEKSGYDWLQYLQGLAETKSLIVSSIVVAEVRSFFPNDTKCMKALSALELRHSALEEKTALLAGKIFRSYHKEGGPRSTILPDFLIAAHASTQADALATEDRGYLRAYFPSIRLLKP